MSKYKVLDRSVDKVMFAMSDNRKNTARNSVAITNKNISTAVVPNVKTEFKTVDYLPVTLGDAVVGDEIVPITVTISGSIQNATEIEALVLRNLRIVEANLSQWLRGWKTDTDIDFTTTTE